MAKIYEIIARQQRSIEELEKKAGQTLDFDGDNLALKNGQEEVLSQVDLSQFHNQNAFSSVTSPGNDTIKAKKPTSSLSIEGQAGVKIVTDKTNNTINIVGPDILYRLV